MHQEKQEGLGYAISQAGPYIDDGPILIVLDDGIFEFDPERVINSPDSLIGVRAVDNPNAFGIVEIDKSSPSSSLSISRLVEKPEVPPTNLAIAGMYYLKNGRLLIDCLDYLIENDLRGAKNEFQLTDGLQLMLERGEKMQAVEIDWIDCGKVDALLYANRTLLARNENQFSVAGTKDVIFIPPV